MVETQHLHKKYHLDIQHVYINHRINRLHERALKIPYNNYTSTFDEVLVQEDSVNIHQRNLTALGTEMYKIYHNLSPLFIRELFNKKRSLQY